MLHTHTYLLRTVLANFDVERIVRAKTIQVNLTGESHGHHPRNSDMFPVNRLRRPCRHWNDTARNLKVWFGLTQCEIQSGKVVLGLATSHCRKGTWNEAGSTSIQRPGSISQNVIAVFVGCRTMTVPAAPCLWYIYIYINENSKTWTSRAYLREKMKA